ncbi:MAG: type II CAAX endopeptidase family protein, partial [Acidobacteriota bacterium]
MTRSPITGLQALKLIIKLKLLRIQTHMAVTVLPKSEKKAPNPQRTGTVRKNSLSTQGIAVILMALPFAFIYGGAIIKILNERLPPDQFFTAVSFEAAFLFLALTLLSIGLNQNLAVLDLEVEWLLTMPISTNIIYSSKVAEAAIINLSWFIFPALYGSMLWYNNYRFSLPFITIAFTLITNILIAVIRFSLEILGRRFFSVYAITNLQIACAVFGFVLLWLFFTPFYWVKYIMPFYRQWLPQAGSIAFYFPTGIMLSLIHGSKGLAPWLKAIILLTEFGAILWAGWWLVKRASKRGLEAVQGAYLGKRSIKLIAPKTIFSGITRKEILLLLRNKMQLLSTIGPLISFLVIVLFPVPEMEFRYSIIEKPLYWGTYALIIGLMTAANTVPVVLNHEKDALWLLYTLPNSLMNIVRRKAQIWVVPIWLFSLMIFSAGIIYRGKFQKEDLIALIWLFLGIPLHAMLCASWSVFVVDPARQEKSRGVIQQIGPIIAIYSFFLIAGMYTPTIWTKICSLLLFAMLALARWHKASIYSDYILDPTATPPPRIHVADGLMAVLLYFLLQILFTILFSLVLNFHIAIASLLSYIIASVATVLIVWAYLQVEGLKMFESIRFWTRDEKEVRPAVIATLKAVGATLVVVAITALLLPQESLKSLERPNEGWAVILLLGLTPLVVLVMHPLVEEVLYRGMIFQGLCQSMGFLWAAILSALIFAILQPTLWAAPAFIIGLAMAWVYKRAGVLFAPIVVNAVFSGAIALLQ